jgi:hypothetical protein
METHSYDDLLSCIMYTRHLFSLYLYSDSTEMYVSSDLLSVLLQLDLYAYTDFLLTTKLPAESQLESGVSNASKDTSSVEIKS